MWASKESTESTMTPRSQALSEG